MNQRTIEVGGRQGRGDPAFQTRTHRVCCDHACSEGRSCSRRAPRASHPIVGEILAIALAAVVIAAALTKTHGFW